MRAMVMSRGGDVGENRLTLQERAVPEPGAGLVRVKVKVCGVCRTDVHIIEDELPPAKRPIVPGHEVVGLVDRIGPGVKTIKEGDRVGIAWLQGTCGRCEFCASGRENLCLGARFTGYHEDGGYA
ncbi:MAG: alcohol dehydrogenase catalytic domain-containing protein, partial [Nitrospiraceae bacterium]